MSDGRTVVQAVYTHDLTAEVDDHDMLRISKLSSSGGRHGKLLVIPLSQSDQLLKLVRRIERGASCLPKTNTK